MAPIAWVTLSGSFQCRLAACSCGLALQVFSHSFPAQKATCLRKTRLFPYAYGGVVNKPTLFPMAMAGLMGEAGPEAIFLYGRGRNGRLGVEASGGAATWLLMLMQAAALLKVTTIRFVKTWQCHWHCGSAGRIGQATSSWWFTCKLMATFPTLDPDYGASEKSEPKVSASLSLALATHSTTLASTKTQRFGP